MARLAIPSDAQNRAATVSTYAVEFCAKMAELFAKPSEPRPSGSGPPRFPDAPVWFRLCRVTERSAYLVASAVLSPASGPTVSHLSDEAFRLASRKRSNA